MIEKQLSRREFLRLSKDVLVTSTVFALGCTVENKLQNPEKAESIRQRIRGFEAKNYDNFTESTGETLFRYISQLYEATFGRKPARNQGFRQFLIITNE